MIEVQSNNSSCTCLVVRGNQSMSWRANLWLAASLGIIVLGIAGALASFGLWMVIPFAGAEVVLIVVCLYLTLKRLSRREVITVDREAIRLEWGYTRPDVSVALPRRWSRLKFHSPDSEFENGELSVSAHGRRYRLGDCLNKAEKRTLHDELVLALSRFERPDERLAG